MLQWREENNIEALRAQVQDQPFEQQYFPHWRKMEPYVKSKMTAGVTHQGHLVLIDSIGQMDPKAMFENVSEREVAEFFYAQVTCGVP